MASRFAHQSPFSDPAPHSLPLLDNVPSMVRWVQNLLIYDVAAKPFYGVTLEGDRADDIHIRNVRRMLERIAGFGPPLGHPRAPQDRMAARCGSYALLLVALLRDRGIPARVRSGFATYLKHDTAEDHWVAEYWDGQRWCYADPMFDDVWCRRLNITHNVLDVPKALFLTSGEVWRRCRAGDMNAAKVGITHANLYGLYFVAGSMVREIAALCRVELLPWDVWGAQPKPREELSEDQLSYFDQLAALLADPDDHLDRIQSRFDNDPGLKVSNQVFNALLNRVESVFPTIESRTL